MAATMWRVLVAGLFLIVTSAGASDCQTCLKFCETTRLDINSTNIREKYTFTSPNYTAQSDNKNCSIFLYINDTPNDTVLYIRQYGSTACPQDFNLTNHQDQVVNNTVEEYCTSSGLCTTTALIEKGKHAAFHVPVLNQRDHFNFTVQVYPLFTMRNNEKTPTVDVTSKPAGYIRSHSAFSFNKSLAFDNNKSMILSNLLDIKSIDIVFVYGNLTSGSRCSAGGETVLVKFNAGSTTLAQFSCGNISNMVNNIVLLGNTNNISINFTLPTNYSTSGFLLYYSTNRSDENSEQLSNSSCPLPTQTTSSTSSSSSALINSTPQSRASSFFDKPEHIIAVAAAGGGFVLICVIVGLVCLLTRNRKKFPWKRATMGGDEGRAETTTNGSKKGARPQHGDYYTDIDSQPTGTNASTIEHSSEDGDINHTSSPTRNTDIIAVEEQYASIVKPAKKNQQVEMVDNELYGGI